jgi:mono/diheme cytochrome c family protein
MVKLAVFAALAIPAFSAVAGEEIYQSRCASCHDTGDSRAPARAALQKLSAGRIRRTLESGVMMTIASALNADERAAVASFLGTPGDDRTVAASAYCPDRSVSLTGAAFTWNGWSPSPTNTRYQTA